MMILRFEFKKLIKNKKNITVIASLFLLIIGLTAVKSSQLITEKNRLQQADYYLYLNLASNLQGFQDQSNPNQELLSELIDAVTSLKDKVNYSDEKNWKLSLISNNQFIESVKALQKEDYMDHISEEKLEGKEQNSYHIENNIKPDNSLYGVSAMYYVRTFLSLSFSIAGYLFFIFLFFDLFSKEKEFHHSKWLLTLPVYYSKIVKSKFVLSLLTTIFLLVIGCLFSFGLGFLITHRIGTFNYPVAFKVTSHGIETFSFYAYLFYGLTAFLMMSIIILTLIYLLSIRSISSEKILFISLLVTFIIERITKLLNYNASYFLVLNYFDLNRTLLRLYQENLLMNHIILFILFIIIMSIYLLKKRTYELAKKS